MNVVCKCLCWMIAGFALGPALARAEEFTVPLTLTPQSGKYGDYLSATFDFGTAFSHIDSLTLQFVMPSGYQGTAVSTGNSTLFRLLVTSVYGPQTSVGDISFFSGLVPQNPPAFNVTQLLIQPDVSNEISLGPYYLTINAEPVPPTWPEFMLSGSGQVAFLDFADSVFAPLPDGIPVSSLTSWQLPGEVQSATLTIIATPVPEPESIILLAIAGICMGRCITHRRYRSIGSRPHCEHRQNPPV